MRFSGAFWVFMLALVLMIACLVIASVPFRVAAQPDLPVHNSDTGISYATIQEAIDDNNTLNGQVIRVDTGTYYGTVNVSKAVSLIGENPLSTIIDGQGGDTVVFVHAPNVVINGFTIRNSSSISGSAGVLVFDSNFSSISENIIVGNWYGVWLKSCNNATLTANQFLANTNAFYADSVSNSQVSGNDFSQNDFAVWLKGIDATVFQTNNVSDNNYGVWMAGSSKVSVKENLISHNSDGVSVYSDSTGLAISDNMIDANSSYGIFMNGVTNSSVVGNHVLSEEKEAIFVQNSNSNNFSANTAVSNGHDAVFLELSDTNLLEGNIVTGNTSAVVVSGSKNVRIEENNLTGILKEGIRLTNSPNGRLVGNLVSSSTQGIALVGSSDDLVAQNDILKCDTGMSLLDAHNITVSGNNFESNTIGLILDSSSKSFVHNNTLTGNVDGLRLSQSDNNTIEINTVSFNSGRAISVSDSDFNLIFHNGLFNNSQSSSSSNSSNRWDNEIEGNFWGYEGLNDANRDGLGDQPFVLEGEQRDNFPLMAPYTEFSTVFESREYVVGIVSNSSVSNLAFNRIGEDLTPTMTFRVTAVEGSIFCRTGIPHAMMVSPFESTVDNNPVSYQNVVGSNSTHTWVYLSFPLGGDVRITAGPQPPPFWTEFWFWGIVVLGIVVAVLTSAIFLFYRRLTAYRKNMEEVERRLRERENSPLEVARRMFSSDVERRSVKIGKFEEKYGVKIRPRGSLEEIFRGLEKKKNRGSEEDEDDS